MALPIPDFARLASYRFAILLAAVLLLIGLAACSSTSDSGPESGGGEGEGSGEHGESGENGEGGESGEESATQYTLTETYDEVRAGARLVLRYDAATQTFTGTVANTTSATLSRVRVEVHLSNGVELGPTAPMDLVPGQTSPVTLTAIGQVFATWGAHPEVGSATGDAAEGSSGAMPMGPVSLAEIGTARATGTTKYSVANAGGRFPGTFSGTRDYYQFDEWGLEATQGGSTLFKAFFRESTGITSIGDYEFVVEGTPASTNPAAGLAVWSGGVRAYDAHPDSFGQPVTGDARLQFDFAMETLSADFTGFSDGHADVSWSAIPALGGGFQQTTGFERIEGAFYGAGHEGVAGIFMTRRLDGVFGAARNEE